jgi:methylmalonyl-CoA carboxyltransferase large subunit
MFVYGPPVIEQATGVKITPEALGGTDLHMQRSGAAHFVAENDQEAIAICRRLLTFLPSNHRETPPRLSADHSTAPNAELQKIVPPNLNDPYDVRDVITGIVDGGDFLEVQSGYAENIVVGFAHVAGRSVGIVANQPLVLGGAIDRDAANTASRFVRFCDAFNIPIVTLVDAPGLLASVEQEQAGVVRSGAQLMFALAAATVPKIQVILRKAYGAGHVSMCSKDLGADRVFAWPTAEVAVMDAANAVEIVFRGELQNAADKEARRAELIGEYRTRHSSPLSAAERRLVDDVIEPANTRHRLAQALEYLQDKTEHRPLKKHGLIPL